MRHGTPVKRPGQHGFTLLEIILAVALVVGLMAAVYSFYNTTLSLRNDLKRSGKVQFAQRRVLDLLGADLQSALAYPGMASPLSGASDQVVFTRAVLPSQAVYFTPTLIVHAAPTATSAPAWEPEHDVQLVTYRLGTGTDEEGNEVITGLERTCLRTLAATTAEEGSNIHVEQMSDQIKFLHVQYWDGSTWQETWANSYLPAAVRVELGLQPLPADCTPDLYPYEKVWREISLASGGQPAARPTQGGAASQPGGGL